jgi:hypothetical protein
MTREEHHFARLDDHAPSVEDLGRGIHDSH